MLLSWLSRFCATLLVPILFVVTFGLVLTQTVFNAQYLKDQFRQHNTYSKLSDGITKEIAKDPKYAGLPTDLVESQIKTLATPQVAEAKTNRAIDQYVAYIHGKGPAPTLDLSDLVQQAQAAGLPTPSDPKFQQPMTIPGTDKAKQASKAVHTALLLGAVATLVLIATMFAVAIARRNFKPIANLLISLGIVVLLSGLGLHFIPSALSDMVKLGTGNLGVDAARDLVTAIAQDVGKRLLIIGGIYFVIGIIARLIFGLLGRRKPTGTPSPPPPSNPGQPTPHQFQSPPLPTERPVRKIQL